MLPQLAAAPALLLRAVSRAASQRGRTKQSHFTFGPINNADAALLAPSASFIARHLATGAASQPGHCSDLQAAGDATLPLSLPAYTIWGANTDVGKTLVSAGLTRALATALQARLLMLMEGV